VVDGGGLENH